MVQSSNSHNFKEKQLGSSSDTTGRKKKTEKEEVNSKQDDSHNKTKNKRENRLQEDQNSKMNNIEQRAQDSKINKELEEIYTREDGKTPDMSRFDTNKSSGIFSAFIILLISMLFLGGVAWFGFFWFQPQDRFSEKQINFSLSGNQEVSVGDKVHYQIQYHNNQSIPLSKAEIFVRYPDGFEFNRSDPDPTNGNNTWKLGTISEQGGGMIDIYGTLKGDINEKKSLRTFLNYIPSNFSSEFQKIEELNTTISNAPISLSLSGPSEVNADQKNKWAVTIKNDSATSSEELVLEIKSDDFNLIRSNLSTSSYKDDTFTLEGVRSSKKITLEGKFSPSKTEKQTRQLQVRIYSKNKEDPSTIMGSLLASKKKKVKVVDTNFSTQLAINGSVDNFVAKPGESLNTSLRLENRSSDTLKNIKAKLTFDAPSNDRSPVLQRSILDWRNISNPGTEDIVGNQINDDIRRGSLTWTNKQMSQLTQLESGDQVNIDFSLPIKAKEQVDLTEFDTYKVTVTGDIQYTLNGERKTVSTDKMSIIINSDTKLKTQNTITENDQDEKMYNISWILENSFHKLKNIKITSNVYGDVAWVEEALNTTTGTAKFNKDDKKIIWRIEELSQGDQVQSFNFALVPKQNDPTQTNLTSKAKLEAKDVTTGKKIITTASEILLRENNTSSKPNTQ